MKLDELIASVGDPVKRGRLQATIHAANIPAETIDVVDPPSIIVGPTPLPEGDITATINTQMVNHGKQLFLKPGGRYTLGGAVWAADGCKLWSDPKNQANIQLTKTGIDLQGQQYEIYGIKATGFAKFLEFRKPGYVHDCSGENIGGFGTVEGTCVGLLIQDIVLSNCGGDGLYIVGSSTTVRRFKVMSMTSPLSEHCIRIDQSADGRYVPDNILLEDCDLTNHSISNKETLAVRRAKKVIWRGGFSRGYMRAGQQAGASTETVADLTIDSVNFPDAVGGALIDLKDGVTASIIKANFGPFVNKRQGCIRVGLSKLTADHNILNGVVGTPAVPMIAFDPGSTVIETNPVYLP